MSLREPGVHAGLYEVLRTAWASRRRAVHGAADLTAGAFHHHVSVNDVSVAF